MVILNVCTTGGLNINLYKYIKYKFQITCPDVSQSVIPILLLCTDTDAVKTTNDANNKY